MKYHKITLEPQVRLFDSYTPQHFEFKAFNIDFILSFNGEIFNKGLDVDVFNIMDMLSSEYEYSHTFWNCDCGTRECARIEDMELLNEHSDSYLKFKVPFPIQSKEDYSNWENTRILKIITISKEQLHEEFLRILPIIKSMIDSQDAYFLGYAAGENINDRFESIVPDIFAYFEKICHQKNLKKTSEEIHFLSPNQKLF